MSYEKIDGFCATCQTDDVIKMRAILVKHPHLMQTDAINLIKSAISFGCTHILKMFLCETRLPVAKTFKLLREAHEQKRDDITRVLFKHSLAMISVVKKYAVRLFHLLAEDATLASIVGVEFLEWNLATNGPLCLMETPDFSEILPAQLVAAAGNVVFLKQMFSVDPEAVLICTQFGSTALHTAIDANQIECVRFLVKTCPQLCNLTDDGENPTPLDIAIGINNLEIIELLVTHCPEAMAAHYCDNGDYRLPFQEAICCGNLDAIKLLLRLCPNAIDDTSLDGTSILYDMRDPEIARYLLQAKPSLIDNVDNIGRTPLHYETDGETALVLLKAKPELASHKDTKGRTPLHIAWKHGEFSTVQAILTFCPSLPYTDKNNNTALHLIVKSSMLFDAVKRVFENNPADVLSKNNEGHTPFHIALRCDTQHFEDYPRYDNDETLCASSRSMAQCVALFESVVTLGSITDIYTECEKSFAHLKPRVVDQCGDMPLPSDIRDIVYQFLGFEHTRANKKARHL